MDASAPHIEPNPQDSLDAEKRVAGLTGMTPDAAHAFMEFHSGMRWLRPKDA